VLERLSNLLARTSVRRGAIALAFVALLLALLLPFWPAGHPGAPKRYVTVAPHADALSVASSMRSHHVIRNRWAFAALIRVMGGADRIQPGTYALSPGQNGFELVHWLMTGIGRQQRLVVPEGYSIGKIARILDARGIATGSVFVTLAHSPSRFYPRHPWLRQIGAGRSLEGFLFPATYLIEGDRIDEGVLIDRMLTRFQEVMLKRYEGEPSPTLELVPALTLASIIELEAARPQERAVISGVFYNRLAKGMRLGSDPTVEYALGRHQGARGLSLKDVQVQSPYNTYLHAGLPPGPIGNPGLASFVAALRPAQTPYLFFVARGDGTHVFSETYQQHLAAHHALKAGG